MISEEKAVMYLGPSIRGVVKYGAVFRGGIPKNLEKITKRKALMSYLIAPVDQIVERKKQIDTEGTVEFMAYDIIAQLKQNEIQNILKEGE